jgi:hypothetical protein
MNDASRYMKENGILVAYLQGIGDFYHRFGYYPFMAATRVEFNRDAARGETRPGKLRPMRKADLTTAAQLYAAVTAGRMCAADRDESLWRWLFARRRQTWLFQNPRLILDPDGRACGYMTTQPGDRLSVQELIVSPDEPSCRAALGAMVREARRSEIREITVNLPPDDAMAVFLRHFVPCRLVMDSHSTGGALMKVVDLPGLMGRLAPALTGRWRRSSRCDERAAFTLQAGADRVGIMISGGAVRVGEAPGGSAHVRIPARWLPGMLTGYHQPSRIRERDGVHIPKKWLEPLQILFPPGYPYVYKADNY